MRAYAAERRVNAGQLFLYELARLFHHQLRRLRPYRSVARARRWRRLKERRWFTPSLIDRLDASDPGYEDPQLDTVLRRSVERTPLPHYLRLEDRNSMAHGVEARLPFMDYRLVSLAFRAGVDRKIEGVWNKALLRRSLRGRIPDSVRTRAEKMGFPTSLHVWLTSVLVEPLRDVLGSRAARERGIYNVPEMLSVLQNNHRVEPETALRLFHVAEFEIWHSVHSD